MKLKKTLALIVLASFSTMSEARRKKEHWTIWGRPKIQHYTVATDVSGLKEGETVVKVDKNEQNDETKRRLKEKNKNPHCFGTFWCVKKPDCKDGFDRHYIVSYLLLNSQETNKRTRR